MTVERSRRPRADAQRNRDAIMAAARSVFESDGVLAPIDAIAVRAGVGNATLYRNFPTRDDLLSAVIAESVSGTVRESAELDGYGDARVSLTQWLIRVCWSLRIWHDLPTCVVGDGETQRSSGISPACIPLVQRTGELVQAAQAAGVMGEDVTPDELFELITAISWCADRFGDDEVTAQRRVERAVAGFFSP